MAQHSKESNGAAEGKGREIVRREGYVDLTRTTHLGCSTNGRPYRVEHEQTSSGADVRARVAIAWEVAIFFHSKERMHETNQC